MENNYSGNCIVCGMGKIYSAINGEYKIIKEIDRMGYGKDKDKEFIYVKCENCGTWSLINIPDFMDEYYPADEYYSYQSKDKEIEIEDIVAIKKQMAKYFIDTYNLDDKSKVLDYGCGNNQLLRCIHDVGVGSDDGTSLIGYEPYCKESYISKEGIKVQKEPITNLDNHFDFIILNHVIEHAINPMDILLDCKRLLNKNFGRLYIGFPNPDSIVFDVFKGHVPELDAPRHINVMPPQAIDFLLKKAGMKVIGKGYIHSGTSFSPFFGLKYIAGKGYLDKWEEDKPMLWSQCEGFASIANRLERGSSGEVLCVCNEYKTM